MTETSPLISIIILGHNGFQYIPGCLGSVMEQNFPASLVEVIWADNCSADASVSYIRENFPTVRVLEFDRNYGFALGNNLALPYARGKYLVFLNQDTVVHQNWLAGLLKTMENYPELGACQSNMFMPWHHGFDAFERHRIPDEIHYTEISQYGYVEYRSEKLDERDLISTSFITGASFIIRREVVDRLEYLFYPSLNTYSEDLELSLRLKRLGYGLGVATRSVVFHLQYTRVNNLSHALWKAFISNRNRFWAYRINLSNRNFWAFTPKLLWGAPEKVKEFGWGKLKTFVFSALMIPIALVAYIDALVKSSNQSIRPGALKGSS